MTRFRNLIVCTAGGLLLATGVAAAAPARVATDLNVRSGEGTGYPVVAVMPAGSVVDVTGCADGWCFVGDYGGFASAAYLDRADVYVGRSYAAPPAVVVPAPVYRAPYYVDRDRFIRRGVRQFRQQQRQERRETRQELRQDRREARQDLRQQRRDARQQAREARGQAR
jgi:uncharacterized protein YraI